MRKAIRNCYAHYKSEFLIDFSERLMKCSQQPGSVILIENNNNGTRSMKTADHQKLLVTFKALNQVNILIFDREIIFGHMPIYLECKINSIDTIFNAF